MFKAHVQEKSTNGKDIGSAAIQRGLVRNCFENFCNFPEESVKNDLQSVKLWFFGVNVDLWAGETVSESTR